MARKPSVDIVIPVYNEEKELEESVEALVQFFQKELTDFAWTISIVDNASTDRTWPMAQNLAKKQNVSAYHLDQKGRGRAVKFIWLKSNSTIVSYMDVDLSTDLKHFSPLLHSLLQTYDIAIGTRNAPGSRVSGRNLLRNITSKGYIFLIKLLFWVHFSDAQCGFKAMNTDIAKKLLPLVKDNEWFFDTEFLILAEKMGYKIYEEPVTWIDNPGSTVRVWKTMMGDLAGLWHLFWTRPWNYGRT